MKYKTRGKLYTQRKNVTVPSINQTSCFKICHVAVKDNSVGRIMSQEGFWIWRWKKEADGREKIKQIKKTKQTKTTTNKRKNDLTSVYFILPSPDDGSLEPKRYNVDFLLH